MVAVIADKNSNIRKFAPLHKKIILIEEQFPQTPVKVGYR